jgi:hypothetical protein
MGRSRLLVPLLFPESNFISSRHIQFPSGRVIRRNTLPATTAASNRPYGVAVDFNVKPRTASNTHGLPVA